MTRYHANNCRSYVGQAVRVHTQTDVHHGIVDRVNSKGLYLRPMQHVSGDDELVVELAYGPGGRRPGGYGYGYGYGSEYNPAAFFIPFLSILALSSLFFW